MFCETTCCRYSFQALSSALAGATGAVTAAAGFFAVSPWSSALSQALSARVVASRSRAIEWRVMTGLYVCAGDGSTVGLPGEARRRPGPARRQRGRDLGVHEGGD